MRLQMIRYDFEIIENDMGGYVDYEEARDDIFWLVKLIKDKKIEGSKSEYVEFDYICNKWGVD